MKRIFLVFMLILSCSTFSSASIAVEIQNFRSGHVCTYQSDTPEGQLSIGWICFEAEIVHITGQGSCFFGGEEKQCTWYGYEFDYTNATADDEILCILSSSEPVNFGNPQKIEEKDTTTFEYTIDLVPGDGHHYNPQYSVFTHPMADERMVNDETVCSVDGQELFRFRFRLVYPKVDKELVRNPLRPTVSSPQEVSDR